jgi:hypothetical protein
MNTPGGVRHAPPPHWQPKSPEFWRAVNRWLESPIKLTDSEHAYHLAACEAPVGEPRQGRIL